MRFRVRHLIVWSLLLQSMSLLAVGDVSTSFDAANKLYEQGKFSEAASAYQTIIRSGSVSPALYFNLGNAFYKAGEIGRAVATYREAMRIAPRDPELRANLQFVRGQVQSPTLLPNGFQRWLNRLTFNEWTITATVALWVWLLLAATGQIRPAWKPALRTLARLAFVVTVVCSVCVAAQARFAFKPAAVVVAHDAIVHSGPLDESPRAFTVHDGAELNVLDHKNDWLQIAAGDRLIGWLKRDEVLLLSPQTALPKAGTGGASAAYVLH